MNNNSRIFNKKSLKNYRKNLRNKSTSAESTLWTLVKNNQMEGRKFRRQQSIFNYIVDFYCHSEKIIIELDGNRHGDYIQIEQDSERDAQLERLGFKVLRFENKLVFQEPEYILSEIKKQFK
jgi:very-short-patch-repair endonuclease